MRAFLKRYADDVLVLIGCVCILIGLAMISAVVTWIAGGIMLILMGLAIGKARANVNQ